MQTIHIQDDGDPYAEARALLAEARDRIAEAEAKFLADSKRHVARKRKPNAAGKRAKV
jgi:hypothetical protein